jgi:hypothetical protein
MFHLRRLARRLKELLEPSSVIVDVFYRGAATGEIVEDGVQRSHRTFERNAL